MREEREMCETSDDDHEYGSQQAEYESQCHAVLKRWFTGTQNYFHDIDDQNDKGRTRLHEACMLGDIKHARELVERGASIDIQDDNGFTPIMCAVWMNNTDVLKWLLDLGADRNKSNYSGFCPLKIAQIRGCEVAMGLLSVVE